MRDRTYISLFHTNFETKETREIKFAFDKIDKVDIDISLQVCTSDTVRGKNKTDHAYRKQNTISMSGTFSERTLDDLNSTFFKFGTNKLKNVQELFLSFLNDSRLFYVYTRVKTYKNYVLKSCSFSLSSSVSSVEVTLGFVEVMLRNNEGLYLESYNYVIPQVQVPYSPPLSDVTIEETILIDGLLSIEDVYTRTEVTEEEITLPVEHANGDVGLVDTYNTIVKKVYTSGSRRVIILGGY